MRRHSSRLGTAPHPLKAAVDVNARAAASLASAEEERVELLAGAMELEIGSERHVLNRGDGALIPAGTPHSWRNPGTEVLHFMFDLELIG